MLRFGGNILRKLGLKKSKKSGPDEGGPKTPRRPKGGKPKTITRQDYKVVVFGGKETGKTAIINRFVQGTFPETYESTVEDIYHRDFGLWGWYLNFHIIDSCGDDEFPAMRELSIRNSDAFVLVYDVSRPETLEIVRSIRDQIHTIKETENVPIVVVGNKLDLIEQQEEQEMELRLTESVVTLDWDNGFVAASAKNNINILKIFEELLHQSRIPYDLAEALRTERK